MGFTLILSHQRYFEGTAHNYRDKKINKVGDFSIPKLHKTINNFTSGLFAEFHPTSSVLRKLIRTSGLSSFSLLTC